MGTYGDDAITLYIESSNGNTSKIVILQLY